MTTTDIASQYATGLSLKGIEQALLAAGKELDRLEPADLGALEDFHTMGRIATGQLAELAQVTSADRVLDAGTGIGGAARFLASSVGCHVTAIDLTSEYCEIATWLNTLTGLDGNIDVRQGDVTDLPFPDGSFDLVTSLHVQMNVADKDRLYSEARRALAPGGRLAIWDITESGTGEGEPLRYPMPWADGPGRSYLTTPEGLRAAMETAGFAVTHWADLTGSVGPFMQAVAAAPPSPLGLHAFVPDFAAKLVNISNGIASGRLRVIQAIAVAPR